MNFRISRFTGPRWDFIERAFNNNDHDQPVPGGYMALPKPDKDKPKKHTNLLCLVNHYMIFKEERHD